MRPLICVLLCAVTASAQQAPVPVEPPASVYVTAIDVVADVRDSAGKLPAGLTPADFVVIEDGVERKVIGVDYLRVDRQAPAAPQPAEAAAAPPVERRPKPWQTVIYFESELSNGKGRRQTAKELSKHADKLVQMGTVDVIFANPRPEPLLLNSRDAEAVRKALAVVEKSGGAHQLAMHRREFLQYVQVSTQTEAIRAASDRYTSNDSGTGLVKVPPPPPKSNMSAAVTAVEVKLVMPYIEQEIHMINRFRKNLITWLSNYGHHAPRTLIMVTDGYDLDPLEYYSSLLNKGDELELRSYLAQSGLVDASAKMAKALASAGWTTVTVQGDSLTDGWINDPSTFSVGHVHKFNTSNPQVGPRDLIYRPAEPLRQVADETGGEVVGNSGKIAAAMDRIDDRLRITYQVDRKPDGKARKIVLRARDSKLKVHATQWASSSTPDEMAEQRALAQLNEPESAFTGDLPLEATVEWSPNTARKQGTLRVVSKVPGFTKGDFRFTLAVLVPPKEAFVTSRQLAGYQLPNGEFRLRTPIDLPPATSVVVISIEETSTGMWGSSRIKVQ